MPIDCLCCPNYIEILKNVNHAQHTEVILYGVRVQVHGIATHILDHFGVARQPVSSEWVLPVAGLLPVTFQYVLVRVVYQAQWHL